MQDLFSNLSQVEIDCIKYIGKDTGCDYAALLFNVGDVDGVIDELIEAGLIRETIPNGGGLEVTSKGDAALWYWHDSEEEKYKKQRKSNIRFLITYGITTAISIIALINSIIARLER